ncbi:TPA: XcbB/CpsF family capsular polysaccharide biosynthesis protein [Aeromonas salmonicida subsp. pectinolytica]
MSVYKINTGEFNILVAQRKDEAIREELLELFKQDLFFYHFSKGVNYFKKRNDFLGSYELVDNKTYFIFRDLMYKVEDCDSDVNNILICFSSMPLIADSSSSSVFKRFCVDNYQNIRKHLPQGTLIIRVYDINRRVGSFYCNTNNFMDYESQIQELIGDVSVKYPNASICLWGTSKGGTAALKYGQLMNLDFVANDPIISLAHGDLDRTKATFLDDFKNDILVEPYRDYSKSGAIISSEKIAKNFFFAKEFKSNHINVYNMNLPEITNHGEVLKQSLSINIAEINNAFHKKYLY